MFFRCLSRIQRLKTAAGEFLDLDVGLAHCHNANLARNGVELVGLKGIGLLAVHIEGADIPLKAELDFVLPHGHGDGGVVPDHIIDAVAGFEIPARVDEGRSTGVHTLEARPIVAVCAEHQAKSAPVVHGLQDKFHLAVSQHGRVFVHQHGLALNAQAAVLIQGEAATAALFDQSLKSHEIITVLYRLICFVLQQGYLGRCAESKVEGERNPIRTIGKICTLDGDGAVLHGVVLAFHKRSLTILDLHQAVARAQVHGEGYILHTPLLLSNLQLIGCNGGNNIFTVLEVIEVGMATALSFAPHTGTQFASANVERSYISLISRLIIENDLYMGTLKFHTNLDRLAIFHGRGLHTQVSIRSSTHRPLPAVPLIVADSSKTIGILITEGNAGTITLLCSHDCLYKTVFDQRRAVIVERSMCTAGSIHLLQAEFAIFKVNFTVVTAQHPVIHILSGGEILVIYTSIFSCRRIPC